MTRTFTMVRTEIRETCAHIRTYVCVVGVLRS